MTPSRVPVTSEGPALAHALDFAGQATACFDLWLSENRKGFLGVEDVVEIVRFFLDGDRPHRIAYSSGEVADEEMALQYGTSSSYRGQPIPGFKRALELLPYAAIWAARCKAAEEDPDADEPPMRRALDAYSGANETPFCPKLDQREEG